MSIGHFDDYDDASEDFRLDDITPELLNTPSPVDELDVEPLGRPEPRARKWRSVEDYREWKRLSSQLGLQDFDDI